MNNENNENFWFDYKTWCVLFEINLLQIASMTEFISNYINVNGKFIYEKTKFYQLETIDINYKLLREDAGRFRPYIDIDKSISYPKIPEGFYGINNIQELLYNENLNCNKTKISLQELYEALSIDSFKFISELNTIDRIVIVTIITCEYLNCSYLQGMHDIIGCLAFLKTSPVPIVYHALLSIEIIKKWGPFLILPNLFNSSYFSQKKILNNNLKDSSDKFCIGSSIEIPEKTDNIFGFIYQSLVSEDFYISKTYNDSETIFGNLFTNFNLKNLYCSNNFSTNTEFDNESTNLFQKYLLKDFKDQISDTTDQLITICNEFQILGNFHIPNIFKDIEKFIGSNIWCCNVFVTCGSSLFREISNVLLFWLNLLFSSHDAVYKPPYYPKILNSLHISAFLITILKVCEHILMENIYLICTDQFKLDFEINLRIGIVGILQPFLIPNTKIKGSNIIKKITNDYITFESIQNEKKSILIDLFQIILAMDNLLCSTPLSLQRRIAFASEKFNSFVDKEFRYLNYFHINFIEPKEFIFYDSNYEIKKKKGIERIKTKISGKDIVLIDVLSSFFLDNVQTNHLEKINIRLKQIEELIIMKKSLKNYFQYNEIIELFDEELSSIILLPLLRYCLKTVRLIKIPLEREKEDYFTHQVLEQFLDFSSRRQRALLIQNRPCIWILLTSTDKKLTSNLISKLFDAGVVGLQFMDSFFLFCELIKQLLTKDSEILIKVIRETIASLNLGNYRLNYKNRMHLNKNLKKKKISEKMEVDFPAPKFENEELFLKNEVNIREMQQETICKNNIIKFKPNRRKKLK